MLMLRKFYKKFINSLEKNQYIREKYLQLAIFCSNHGVKPPFSPGYTKIERVFRNQDRNDPQRNPYLYTKYDDAIGLMFEDLLPFLEKDSNVLEIGCNAGRNLHYLFSKGYKKLTGIEIGIEAEKVMKEIFPEVYKVTTFIVGNAYEELCKLPSSHYDLVFCHGVLVNIAPKWNGIFKEIARVSKSYVLTLESEGSYKAYPRNFEKMFKRVNYKQILYKLYRSYKGENKRILAPDFTGYDKMFNNTIRLFVPIKKEMPSLLQKKYEKILND